MHQPSPEVRAALARLLKLPLQGAEPLRQRVQTHLERVLLNQHEDTDLELAHALAEACRELLAGWDALDAEGQCQVQAACLYFAEPEDAEDDLDLIGFEDDAEAVVWAAGQVGRDDLVERIRATWR